MFANLNGNVFKSNEKVPGTIKQSHIIFIESNQVGALLENILVNIIYFIKLLHFLNFNISCNNIECLTVSSKMIIKYDLFCNVYYYILLL